MRTLTLSLLLALAVVPFASHAKTNKTPNTKTPSIKINKQDFVGTWLCQNHTERDDGSIEIGRTMDSIYTDGTMFQVWEVTEYDTPDRINSVEFSVVKNRWDYSNKDGFKIYDLTFQDYRLYDDNKTAMGDDTQQAMKAYWQEVYAEPYSEKVAFTSTAKDRFIFLDLPKEVKQADCKRIG